MCPSIPSRAVLVAAFALVAAISNAQVVVGGNVSDGSGGPFLSGTVYVVNANITVPVATTLTINAGAIVKFNFGAGLQIDGTLHVNGTSGNRIYFTSLRDDTVGGDTNANGVSTGAPGDWSGLHFADTSDASNLTQCEVRFSGYNSNPGVTLTMANILMSATDIKSGYQIGLDLNQAGGLSLPTVTGCSFQGNGGVAVGNADIRSVPGFSNNSASANSQNYMNVTGTVVSSNVTIAANNVFGGALVVNGLTVPATRTLTLQAGVNLKLPIGFAVGVDGTLITTGTAGSPVVLTSIRDDSVGGDTNTNGPSTGGIGDWSGLTFSSTASASNCAYMKVRYSGYNFTAGVSLVAASPTFTNSTFELGYSEGMRLNESLGLSAPVVSNCVFNANGGPAVGSARITGLAGFSTNTATGNGGNYIAVSNGTVAGTVTLAPASQLGGALYFPNGITVPAATTLVMQAGMVLKMAVGPAVDVTGTLLCNGTAGSQVNFTSIKDDSVGGDTNNNGVSAGVPADWSGMTFHAGSQASVLTQTRVRYSGYNFSPGVRLENSAITMNGCVVSNGYSVGIELNLPAGPAFPTITGCTMTLNGGVAINNARINQLSMLSNNTATGNGSNYIYVSDGTTVGDVTVPLAACINGVFVTNGISVPVGTSLTLAPGVIVKGTTGYGISVAGNLQAIGTVAQPIVFTSLNDDAFGGDTNNNGASSGGPTETSGLSFASTSSASVLDQTIIRYSGYNFLPGIALNAANITIKRSVIAYCYSHGLQLNSNSSPIVQSCIFTGSGGAAVHGVKMTAVPGFYENSASGNGGGNCMFITDPTPGISTTVTKPACLNGALVLAASGSIPPGNTLNLLPGVAFKFSTGASFTVNGAMNVTGSGAEPVTFTSFADDSVGGDTNNNGPSSGGATDWSGLVYSATASPCLVENLVVRYVGYNFTTGLTLSSPNVIARSVRVERGYSLGVQINALNGNAHDFVVVNNGSGGIQVTAGGCQFLHATVSGNGGYGINSNGTWTGSIRNSIVWGNTTNLSPSITGAMVSFTDGAFAGSNGNLNVDPQFTNATVFDYTLQAASPCIGTADVLTAVAVARDWSENSRLVDSNLIGIPAPDMGAFERCPWLMTTTGQPRLGYTMTFTVTGPVGTSLYAVGPMDGVVPVNPFGMELVGQIPSLLILGSFPTGFALPITIPQVPALLGFQFGVQTATTLNANPAVGAFTNVYRNFVIPN